MAPLQRPPVRRTHEEKPPQRSRCGGFPRWPGPGSNRRPSAFPSGRHKRLRDNLRRSWHAVRGRLGLDDLRFHDLRHTCITLLLDLGVPPHIVREIAGHSDVGVTMKVYAHASLAERLKALSRLGEALSKPRALAPSVPPVPGKIQVLPGTGVLRGR